MPEETQATMALFDGLVCDLSKARRKVLIIGGISSMSLLSISLFWRMTAPLFSFSNDSVGGYGTPTDRCTLPLGQLKILFFIDSRDRADT
jgi:hypothetical protein